MDLKEKLNLLLTEIDSNIIYFNQKHKWTKRRATAIKISSVTFSAFITVLLGLEMGDLAYLLKNAAIVLGALVTIINAVDAFYNYNALWVKNTITMTKLKELKREILYYSAGCGECDMSESKLNRYMNELQRILKEDVKQWTRIRERALNPEQEKDPANLLDIKTRGGDGAGDKFRSLETEQVKE